MLIPFDQLIKKHEINPKGVLHIGANNAAECEIYYQNGIERTIWVEALPTVFKELQSVIAPYKDAIAINACVSDKDGESVVFNVSSNNGESSSMLEFGTHAKNHPDVTFNGKINLVTKRIDTLLSSSKIDIRAYDFLNIDVQGVEHLVLKGMGDMIRVFDFVYIEVNREEVYVGCPLFEDIKTHLEAFGFELKDLKWTGAGWGDAFFIKRKENRMSSVFNRSKIANRLRVLTEKQVQVPHEFLISMPFPYPPDNTVIFENWYRTSYDTPKDRWYLPIQWTAYHVANGFGKNPSAIDRLQRFIDGLDRSKKYYTIYQYDDGALVDFKDLDIICFGMSGGRMDFVLPLICMPHKADCSTQKKTLLYNFIGRDTYPIRTKMLKAIDGKEGTYVSQAKHDVNSFCSILASSKFTLCPRGYGVSSFRIMEAMQYGSIPVIITDNLVWPHDINPASYAIIIPESNVHKIHEILSSVSEVEIKAKADSLKYWYNQIFTYEANKKYILSKLS